MVATRRSAPKTSSSLDSPATAAEDPRVKRALRELQIDGTAALKGDAAPTNQEPVDTYRFRGTAYAITADTKKEWIENQPDRYKKREAPVTAAAPTQSEGEEPKEEEEVTESGPQLKANGAQSKLETKKAAPVKRKHGATEPEAGTQSREQAEPKRDSRKRKRAMTPIEEEDEEEFAAPARAAPKPRKQLKSLRAATEPAERQSTSQKTVLRDNNSRKRQRPMTESAPQAEARDTIGAKRNDPPPPKRKPASAEPGEEEDTRDEQGQQVGDARKRKRGAIDGGEANGEVEDGGDTPGKRAKSGPTEDVSRGATSRARVSRAPAPSPPARLTRASSSVQAGPSQQHVDLTTEDSGPEEEHEEDTETDNVRSGLRRRRHQHAPILGDRDGIPSRDEAPWIKSGITKKLWGDAVYGTCTRIAHLNSRIDFLAAALTRTKYTLARAIRRRNSRINAETNDRNGGNGEQHVRSRGRRRSATASSSGSSGGGGMIIASSSGVQRTAEAQNFVHDEKDMSTTAQIPDSLKSAQAETTAPLADGTTTSRRHHNPPASRFPHPPAAGVWTKPSFTPINSDVRKLRSGRGTTSPASMPGDFNTLSKPQLRNLETSAKQHKHSVSWTLSSQLTKEDRAEAQIKVGIRSGETTVERRRRIQQDLQVARGWWFETSEDEEAEVSEVEDEGEFDDEVEEEEEAEDEEGEEGEEEEEGDDEEL